VGRTVAWLADCCSGSERNRNEAEKTKSPRQYEIKDVPVPTERLEELKKFYRDVSADERSSAVLKKQ
jgi:hypothetical protein